MGEGFQKHYTSTRNTAMKNTYRRRKKNSGGEGGGYIMRVRKFSESHKAGRWYEMYWEVSRIAGERMYTRKKFERKFLGRGTSRRLKKEDQRFGVFLRGGVLKFRTAGNVEQGAGAKTKKRLFKNLKGRNATHHAREERIVTPSKRAAVLGDREGRGE